MAAAGHADGLKGLDFLVRDVASFKLWSQAIQAMLQEALNKIHGVHAVFDSDTLTVDEIVARIRAMRPDQLTAGPRDGS